jgi:uncharacterized repeat protein (TIGR01451 family)
VLPLAAAAALAIGPSAAPAAAQSKTCPQVSPSYTGPCGPTFVLPGWGDAGGWTQPEQYETIQLADVDGDGKDELLARTPAGVEVQVFDTTLGQWRPQIDASGKPLIVTAFADPPPLTTANPKPPATDWTLPQYYDTIQAADIDGDGRTEIVGRSASGLIEFKFTPGASPGQGSWQQLSDPSTSFAGAGWDDPSSYATIQTGDLDGDGDAEVIGRESDGVVAVRWTGSGWARLSNLKFLGDNLGGRDPRYWTSLQIANVAGDRREEVIGRDATGISTWSLRPGGWTHIDRLSHPFSDTSEPGEQDCPFTSSGSACFGDGAAYYGTIQLADIDGNGRAELLGRASDGVRVRRYQGDAPDAWGQLPTLSDLSDANGYTKQQYWETIQFADVNGDHRAEALARDKDGLNAWTYDGGSKAWTKLAPKTPLQLADDPWGMDRSYYSTIETGDVDGDGTADLVARGPYGIRTWFYDRPGRGGWERYLPGGYPDFAGGQKTAFDVLNSLAHTPTWGLLAPDESTVRDVWAGASPPSQEELTRLQDGLVRLGGCVNASGTPPQYQACTPPAGATFTAEDWKYVLNEIFGEIFWATNVWSHFYDSATGLGANFQQLFTQQLGQLSTIAANLNIGAAANAQTMLDPKGLLSATLSVGATFLALSPPFAPAAALVQTAAEIVSLIPSASPLFTDPFTGAYNDLQTKFNDAASEASKAIREQSQLVRQDVNLLRLVGELKQSQTWKLDPAAIASSGGLGFALWVYRELLPTLYVRYVISSCQPDSSEFGVERCTSPATDAPGMLGSATDFTAIGPPPVPNAPFKWGSPCYVNLILREDCAFTALSTDLAKIWAPISDGCTYDPNDSTKAWTFTCNLGVDPNRSISDTPANDLTWDFPTYTGTPYVDSTSKPRTTASATTVGAPGVARAAGAGARRVALRLRTRIELPRSFRLRRAVVSIERLLHEPSGELLRRRSRRPLRLVGGPLRGDGSRLFASRSRRGPLVRLRLRRVGSGFLSIDMRVRRSRVSLPTACRGTRPGVDLAAGRIRLTTRLRVRAGRRLRVVSLSPDWRCRRNRVGAVERLVAGRSRRHTPRRSALAVAVSGRRRLRAGRTATFRIEVRNPGPTTAYDVILRAILPRDLTVRGRRSARTGGREVRWRLRALGPGRSHSTRLRVRVRGPAAGRRRVVVTAQALDTRTSQRQVLLRIPR